MRIMRPSLSLLVVITVMVAGIVPSARGQAAANPAKVAELKMALRDLYVNHIFWVRDLVISTRLGEKAAASEADEYGEKNAKAIGHSIDPIYGQAAGAKFAALFTGHYSAVKDYMHAAYKSNFKGSATLKKAALDKLTKNGNEIAAFLSSANPNLPRATVYGLLVTHVQQHIMSIDATAKKDWSGEADMWDPMVKHIYTICDAVAEAIAKRSQTSFSSLSQSNLPALVYPCANPHNETPARDGVSVGRSNTIGEGEDSWARRGFHSAAGFRAFAPRGRESRPPRCSC